jgi:hypothetical protein
VFHFSLELLKEGLMIEKWLKKPGVYYSMVPDLTTTTDL